MDLDPLARTLMCVTADETVFLLPVDYLLFRFVVAGLPSQGNPFQCVHTFSRIYIRTCVYACICVHICVCVYVCMRVFVVVCFVYLYLYM